MVHFPAFFFVEYALGEKSIASGLCVIDKSGGASRAYGKAVQGGMYVYLGDWPRRANDPPPYGYHDRHRCRHLRDHYHLLSSPRYA